MPKLNIHPEMIATRLARLQMRHPWRFLITAGLITALAGVYASGLQFDSSYEALLPEGAPEIHNLDQVRQKTGGFRQLVIAISGETEQDRQKFATRITSTLRTLPDVKSVDAELPMAFFRDRALWLAEPETLDRLIPALEDAVRIAREQANPMAVRLDPEADKRELKAAWKKVEDIAEEHAIPMEGTFNSRDGNYTFVILVPSIKFSDMGRGQNLMQQIADAVDRANPNAEGLKVSYAGALAILQEQHLVMRRDMLKASLLAILFGIVIVAGATRRPLAPLIVGISLLTGIVWTFAMARLYVGHVNIITGFLAAVLIGLGIDFGIHLFVRFLQEIRQPNTSLDTAYTNFVVGTATPATTAALTTSGVFFTFTIAEFRGFSEFGLIAGTGVLLTLASSFLVLPPLILLLEGRRFRRSDSNSPPIPATPPAATGLPMAVVIPVTVLIVALAAYGITGIGKIPFRNDFRYLRGTSPATEFTDYVNDNLGAGFNPAVFMASTLDDAAVIRNTLRNAVETDRNTATIAAVGNVLGPHDLLPDNIDDLTVRIEKIRAIVEAPSLNRAADQDTTEGKKLRDARRMVQTTTWTFDEIPEEFRHRFTTVDTPREYLIFAWSREPHEADYLAAAWEDRLHQISTTLTDMGILHLMADETHILSWVYRLVTQDALPLLLMSGLIVFVLLLLDFRRIRTVLLLITVLTAGMLMFLAVTRLLKMEINMFNLIVFPSVIGIGIDNAVHILHRYQKEGPGQIRHVLRTTGIAAALASATTAVGFGASIVAHNLGLQSMGIMAVIGISATFVSATLFLPCLLTLLELRNRHPR